jgi:hypothetical protein
MSATMARQGGRVQLEQSDMRLELNMAKTATGGFSHNVIEETQFLIENPCAKVRDKKKLIVGFTGRKMVKATIERHPAMLCQNHTASCLPCQNGTAINPQIRWRLKGSCASPSDRCRHLTAVPMPPQHGMLSLPIMPPLPKTPLPPIIPRAAETPPLPEPYPTPT